MRDQLRSNPQAGVGDRLLARRERERRAHRVDAVDLAGGGQAEARCLVLLRDPGGEEVVLQQRDPTTGDGLVERAVVDEVVVLAPFIAVGGAEPLGAGERSEEHTSELQSLMRISYAVFCLKKKKQTSTYITTT